MVGGDGVGGFGLDKMAQGGGLRTEIWYQQRANYFYCSGLVLKMLDANRLLTSSVVRN